MSVSRFSRPLSRSAEIENIPETCPRSTHTVGRPTLGENILEDLVYARKTPGILPVTCAASRLLPPKTGCSEHIIGFFLLRVGKGLVSVLDLLELLLGFFISLIHIRVMFPGEVSVCFLYLILCCVS